MLRFIKITVIPYLMSMENWFQDPFGGQSAAARILCRLHTLLHAHIYLCTPLKQ